MPPRLIVVAQMVASQTPNELRMSGRSYATYMQSAEIVRMNIRTQIQNMLDNGWTHERIQQEYANDTEIVRVSLEMQMEND